MSSIIAARNIGPNIFFQDPNERRRLALEEIDKAPFGWYHVRAVVVGGIGFFTDSYDVDPPTSNFKGSGADWN
jgi:hypothetical protein